jgi:hypothetical protein
MPFEWSVIVDGRLWGAMPLGGWLSGVAAPLPGPQLHQLAAYCLLPLRSRPA